MAKMQTIVTTPGEVANYQKNISSLSNKDNLILLSQTEDPDLPFSVLNSIMTSKCNIGIEKVDMDNSISLAFMLGRISMKYESMCILSENDVINDIKTLYSSIEPKPTAKRKRTKTSVNPPISTGTSSDISSKEDIVLRKRNISHEPNVLVVAEVEDKSNNPVGNETELIDLEQNIHTSKKEEKTLSKYAPDDEFTILYDELFAVVDKLPKETGFNPTDYMYNIIASFKTMNREGMSLENAVGLECTSLTANKLYRAVKTKKAEINKIIKRLPNE